MADQGAPKPKVRSRKAREQRKRRIIGAAGAALAVALIAGIVVVTSGGEETKAGPIANLQSFEVPEAKHVAERVSYPQSPPVGGDHASSWQNCGAYPTPIASEQGVHSMEHGAVWITYRNGIDTDQLQKLRELTRESSYVLLSPVNDLPAPIVASAWGKQVQLESAMDPRLEAFLEQFVQGPQTVEPGAACSGASGKPL